MTTTKKHGRSRTRRGAGGSHKRSMQGAAIGGLAFGFLIKTFPDLPSMPVIGKSGTVALACYFFGGNNKIVQDIGIAAAAIAGYSLGKEGKIEGYYDDHGLAVES